MKNFKILVLMALTVSCMKIDNFEPPINRAGEYAILFGSQTKAVVNTVSETDYDEFKLFVWNSNNDTIMNPYKVGANGVGSYRYDDIAGQELKYYSNTANYYDFIGVIPTDHKIVLKDGAVKIDTLKAFTVDDSRITGIIADSPEEFLWSYKRVEKTSYGSTVELPFYHGNAVVYLGFSSDRDDTEILDYVPGTPGTPAVNDTTYTWYVRSGTGIDPRTSSPTVVPITDEDVAYINSWFTTDIGTWPTSSSVGYFTVTPKTDNIPEAYKTICETISGKKILVFDARKYLNDKHPGANWGGNWDTDASYGKIIVHLDKPNSYHRAWALNPFQHEVETIVEVTPAVPGVGPIEGVRMFTADSTATYCVHIPHTIVADATVSSTGMVYSNRTTSSDVITFSLPSNKTLDSAPKWSATTFYALPGDENLNFLVVKLSYIYKGVTTYDVRVPIKIKGGLQPGKYYKYELHITSSSNGTNDSDEAAIERDEILIENNPVISVKLIDTGYTEGDNRKITI